MDGCAREHLVDRVFASRRNEDTASTRARSWVREGEGKSGTRPTVSLSKNVGTSDAEEIVALGDPDLETSRMIRTLASSVGALALGG